MPTILQVVWLSDELYNSGKYIKRRKKGVLVLDERIEYPVKQLTTIYGILFAVCTTRAIANRSCPRLLGMLIACKPNVPSSNGRKPISGKRIPSANPAPETYHER